MIVESLRRQRPHDSNYEVCEISNITVLVGPNNAGKTQTLRDIRDLLTGTQDPVIFDDITYGEIDSLSSYLEQLFIIDKDEHSVTVAGQDDQRITIDLARWRRWTTDEIHVQTDEVVETLAPVIVQFLNATSRLQLASNTTVEADVSARNPQNIILSLLYRSSELFDEFRDLFTQVFDVQPLIDYSNQGQIRICVGEADSDPPEHPRELGQFIEDNGFVPLDETGDGYISFAGVIGSLLISQGQLLLLDEPSAFLHPAQSRRLGEWIAETGTSHTEQIILTTHNANFLNGILDATTNVTIYRLNRGTEATTFHQVSQKVANQIVSEPILRSQRVLEAAFRQGAIVCEGGSDRATYETVARLVHDENNIQFIDSIGKGKLDSITGVLAKANIPVATIVDFDVFKQVSTLNNIMRAAGGGLSNNDVQHVLREFNEIKSEIQNEKFDDGIESFSGDHREIIETAIEDAKDYHVYIVPPGTVESWIDLNRSKSYWVSEALEEIADGNCPDDLKEFIYDALSDVHTQYQCSNL